MSIDYIARSNRVVAVQWTGGNQEEVEKAFGTVSTHRRPNISDKLTLSGNGFGPVVAGTWIVYHGNGRFELLSETSFHERYEVAP